MVCDKSASSERGLPLLTHYEHITQCFVLTATTFAHCSRSGGMCPARRISPSPERWPQAHEIASSRTPCQRGGRRRHVDLCLVREDVHRNKNEKPCLSYVNVLIDDLDQDQESTWQLSETKLSRQSYPQTQHEHRVAVRPTCFDKLLQTCNKDNAAMF